MNKALEELSKGLSIPVDSVIETFDKLVSKGIVFTPAKSIKEFESWDLPIRLALQPPSLEGNPSSVTCGPFAIDREKYETIAKKLSKKKDEFHILLCIAKFSYDKTGQALRDDGYQISLPKDEEALCSIFSVIELWDVENPVFCENFVWIVPNTKCRQAIETISGKRYLENDYSWWNVHIDFGEELRLDTLDDYPDSIGVFPAELMESWSKYLPSIASIALTYLYLKSTDGKDFRKFNSRNEFLRFIKEGFAYSKSLHLEPNSDPSNVDRELLIKELCDYNNIPYPTDAHTLFNYLGEVGFVVLKQGEDGIVYGLTQDMKNADEVFAFPQDWQERMMKFLITGSILFSYLTLDEVISEN